MRIKLLIFSIMVFSIILFLFLPSFNNCAIFAGPPIIQKIEDGGDYLETPIYCDDYETAVVNTNKILKVKENNLILFILNENYLQVVIQNKAKIAGKNNYLYKGSVIGAEQSNVKLYLKNDTLNGFLAVGEPWNSTYNITSINKTHNGKPVHIISMIDWEKERKRQKLAHIEPIKLFPIIIKDQKNYILTDQTF